MRYLSIIPNIALIMLLTSISSVSGDSKKTDRPEPVEFVDLERYAGLWYEIAKIPNRFQKKCSGETTALYSIREDGKIDVVNRCNDKTGKPIEAKGIAKVVDKESNAKLKVSFVRLLGIRLFWGDYWIIGLGDDYEYAIVGTPDRKYGWILSRTPSIPSETLDRIYQELRLQGYDPDVFVMTDNPIDQD
jgi:apolipoprotein D and lipocalin family protein